MINLWRKTFAAWQVNGIIYVSIPFTWLFAEAVRFITAQKKPVVVGGPGALLIRDKFEGIAEVRNTIDFCEPVIFHNPLATFTTRGCVNSCSFCAVPKIEGSFKEVSNFIPRPIVCDNNFLACSRKHFDLAIDKLKKMPYVEFNQGLEARLFSKYRAGRIAELKLTDVRFAFDSAGKESFLVDAINLAKKNGIKKISVLMLYGFTDTPADALYRARFLQSIGVNEIYPMRYQPLTSTVKNSFVNKKTGWTEYELQRFRTYFVKARNDIMKNVPYEDFELPKQLRTKNMKGFFFDHIQNREEKEIYEQIPKIS